MAAKPARGTRNGMDGLNGRDGRDSRPMPDPTVPTQVLVDQAVDAVKETFDSRLTGQREVFETRLSGMDEAIKLLQTILDRLPADVDGKVSHLERLHKQKFSTVDVQFESVQTQYKERDERSKAEKTASDTAVAAALQAQKEAAGEQAKSSKESIDKSETGMLERLKAQEVLLATTTKGLDDKIVGSSKGLDEKVIAIDKRMDRFEGAAIGVAAQNVQQQSAAIQERGGSQLNLQMISVFIAVAAVVFSIVMALR